MRLRLPLLTLLLSATLCASLCAATISESVTCSAAGEGGQVLPFHNGVNCSASTTTIHATALLDPILTISGNTATFFFSGQLSASDTGFPNSPGNKALSSFAYSMTDSLMLGGSARPGIVKITETIFSSHGGFADVITDFSFGSFAGHCIDQFCSNNRGTYTLQIDVGQSFPISFQSTGNAISDLMAGAGDAAVNSSIFLSFFEADGIMPVAIVRGGVPEMRTFGLSAIGLLTLLSALRRFQLAASSGS